MWSKLFQQSVATPASRERLSTGPRQQLALWSANSCGRVSVARRGRFSVLQGRWATFDAGILAVRPAAHSTRSMGIRWTAGKHLSSGEEWANLHYLNDRSFSCSVGVVWTGPCVNEANPPLPPKPAALCPWPCHLRMRGALLTATASLGPLDAAACCGKSPHLGTACGECHPPPGLHFPPL